MSDILGNYNRKPVIRTNLQAPINSIPPHEDTIPADCFSYDKIARVFGRKGCCDADRYLMKLLNNLLEAEKGRQIMPIKDDPRGMVIYYRRWILAHLASSIDRRLEMEKFEKLARGWENWDDDNSPEDLDNAVYKNIRDLGISL